MTDLDFSRDAEASHQALPRRKGRHGVWEVFRGGMWVREKSRPPTALEQAAWDAAKKYGGITNAAKELGVSYQTLYYRVRAHMANTGERPAFPFETAAVSGAASSSGPVAVAGHDPAKVSTWKPVDRQAEAARTARERADRAAAAVKAAPIPAALERKTGKTSPAPRAKVREAWERTHSVSVVGRELGMDRSYVRRLLREQGIDTSPQAATREPAAPAVNERPTESGALKAVASEPTSSVPEHVCEACLAGDHEATHYASGMPRTVTCHNEGCVCLWYAIEDETAGVPDAAEAGRIADEMLEDAAAAAKAALRDEADEADQEHQTEQRGDAGDQEGAPVEFPAIHAADRTAAVETLGPLLEPLIDWLREFGPTFDGERRELWIDAFAANVRLAYPAAASREKRAA